MFVTQADDKSSGQKIFLKRFYMCTYTQICIYCMYVVPAVQLKTDFTILYHTTVGMSCSNPVIPISIKEIGDRHALPVSASNNWVSILSFFFFFFELLSA